MNNAEARPVTRLDDQNVVVRAVKVNKHFGSLHVLKDIDFEVRRSEVVVICGPSGSGKSTLLRCINHLEKITSGHIYVNGHMIGYHERGGRLVEDSESNIARQRAEIGMVFQRFNLFPHLTALQNIIEAPVRVRHIPEGQATADAERLLKRVGLLDKRDKYPNQISGGQQQRVAIARALATEPAVIFADEPTGNLDSDSAEEVMQLIDRLNVENGQTFVLVTHAREVAAHANRIVRMRDGEIISDEPTAP